MRQIVLVSMALSFALGCARSYGEITPSLCADGRDNDLNGMIDCDDHGRAGNCCGVVQCGPETYCGALAAADGGVPQARCEATPGFCRDGLDNDGDGLADNDDADCCGLVGGLCEPTRGRCDLDGGQ